MQKETVASAGYKRSAEDPLKTRIISAAVGLAVLAAVIYFFETPVLDVTVALLSGISVYEMLHAAGILKKKFFSGVCIGFGILFSTVFFNIFSIVTILAEFVFAGIVVIFVLTDHRELKITDATFAFFMAIVIPRVFSMLILYREYDSPFSYFLVFLSLGIAWLNDAAAFFVGRKFGKIKLCPEISPHKTVEGAIGGVLGCIVGCSVLMYYFSAQYGLSVDWISFLAFLVIGAGAGILGDLSASIIKRQFGIKDYGNIMPGHGGIMDRFDSWIFVAPLLYIWNIYLPFIV